MSYTPGDDRSIVILLQRIEDLMERLLTQIEVITDEEIDE
jgi:hypothetical protein